MSLTPMEYGGGTKEIAFSGTTDNRGRLGIGTYLNASDVVVGGRITSVQGTACVLGYTADDNPFLLCMAMSSSSFDLIRETAISGYIKIIA